MKLLRYTFSNNHTHDLVDGVDELRSVVVLYTSCALDKLMRCPEFVALIESGLLSTNLIQMLIEAS